MCSGNFKYNFEVFYCSAAFWGGGIFHINVGTLTIKCGSKCATIGHCPWGKANIQSYCRISFSGDSKQFYVFHFEESNVHNGEKMHGG